MAMPVIFVLVAGLYLAFPVIRAPNSSFAFWVSMVPFFAPITMLVRIVSQTPPIWQIRLSLMIGTVTVVLLLWRASRIYRLGIFDVWQKGVHSGSIALGKARLGIDQRSAVKIPLLFHV